MDVQLYYKQLNEHSIVLLYGGIKMKKIYLLDGLCCANCAAKIERGVADIDGVSTASGL